MSGAAKRRCHCHQAEGLSPTQRRDACDELAGSDSVLCSFHSSVVQPNANNEPRGEMRLKKGALISPRRLDCFVGLQQLTHETLRFVRPRVLADSNYDKGSGLEEVEGCIQGEKLGYIS
jgi:hypothetical protein